MQSKDKPVMPRKQDFELKGKGEKQQDQASLIIGSDLRDGKKNQK